MKPSRLRLVGTQTPDANVWEWETETILSVGRVAGVDLLLEDASISRRHAEILWTEKSWNVRDLGSTNGTYINGLRIGRVNRQLKQGDIVRFGNVILIVKQVGEQITKHAQVPEVRHKSLSEINEQIDTIELSQLMAQLPSQPVAGDTRTPKLWRSSVCTLKDLYISLVQEAASFLEATTAFIAVPDHAFQRLVVQVGVGAEIDERDAHAPLRLAEKTFERRESLLFNPHVEEGPEITMMPRRLAESTICAFIRGGSIDLGILQLHRAAGQVPFCDRELLLADALAARAGVRIQTLQASLAYQQQLVLSSVVALAQAVELRDEYTGGHTQRVTDYALLLADKMGLSEQDRYCLQVGTPLHDLGKIGVADSVLRKPGRLSPAEFETMKTHVVQGAHIVEMIPELSPVLAIVRSHHERWDGNGYPDGLAGENIPLLARVVATVDVFDAMTSDRPYRRAMSVDKAFDELRAGAGTQFDPKCVDAFCQVRPQIEKLLRDNTSASNTTRPGEIARIRNDMRRSETAASVSDARNCA